MSTGGTSTKSTCICGWENRRASCDRKGQPRICLQRELHFLVAGAARIWSNWALFRVAKGGPVRRRSELRADRSTSARQTACGNRNRLEQVRQIESVRPNFDGVPLRDPKLTRKRQIDIPILGAPRCYSIQGSHCAERLRRERGLVDVEGAGTTVPGVNAIRVHQVVAVVDGT